MKAKVLNQVNATTAAPTAATDGIQISGRDCPYNQLVQRVAGVDTCLLEVYSTAGSGTPAATMKLWVYDAAVGWMQFGADVTCVVNGTTVRYVAVINGLSVFDRFAVQVSAITTCTLDAYLVSPIAN